MNDTYRRLFFNDDKNIILKHGKPAVLKFTAEKDEVCKKKHRLFFKGESVMFYMWKSETDCIGQYISIDDSLNSDEAKRDRYCLDLSSEREVRYRKTAYKKIQWPPVVSYVHVKDYCTPNWQWGIYCTTRNLKIYKGGFVRFTAEIFYKTNDDNGIALIPDEKYVINITDENCEDKRYSSNITIDNEKIKYIAFLIDADGYSGELYLEQPFFCGEKIPNLLPDFAPTMPLHEKFCWIGVNLSKKEWPKFDVKLNGKNIFNDELFESSHRYSEFEFNLPKGIVREGENTLEIATSKEYSLPVRIKEIGYFVKDEKTFQILFCPEIAYVGKKCKILVRTDKDNVEVKMQETPYFHAEKQIMEKAGLNVFEVTCNQNVLNAKIVLISGEDYDECVVEEIIKKQDDGIITGSGDMIYINHEKIDDVENFLEWYISNEVGNMLTVRNVYRWGGGRKLNPIVWQYFKTLLVKMDIKFANIVDGRDLPGAYCNPSVEMLECESFLGRQGHEYDGQYGYWGAMCLTGIPLREATEELWGRIPRENIEIADLRHNHRNFITKDGKTYLYQCPKTESNMEKAAERFIKSINLMKYKSTRHTGPSTLFKYFYQAGYDWTGAELMYTSFEVTSAAIRGAAYGYDKNKFGAHLAVQWTTTPHNDEYRYRRFRLALYLAYMNGYTDINTEEGFWHLEEYYSAFSRVDDACISHLKQQQDFYRYVKLNERKGTYYTSFAFISGRFDGWNCFDTNTVWGAQSFNYCDAEKSWTLLKKFYPYSNTDRYIIKHPCPVEPVGYYSGTPFGNVDILPIESSAQKFNKYKTLCFVGYNKFVDSDFEKLIGYLKSGGSVIIGWPHLSFTTERLAVEDTALRFKWNEFTKLICDEVESFETITLKGEKIKVNNSVFRNDCEIIVKANNDIPLLIKKQVGRGTLWFINAMEYPAEKAVLPLYKNAIDHCVDKNNSGERVFVNCDKNVQFAIYQKDDGVDIYLLAIDWWSAQNHTVQIVIAKNRYDLNVSLGTMVKVVVNNEIAAWIEDENAVVTEVTDNYISISGKGKHTLCVAKNNVVLKREVELIHFSEKTVMI